MVPSEAHYPTVSDLNNPQEDIRAFIHKRADKRTYSDKLRESEEARKRNTLPAPISVAPGDLIPPPKGQYPLPPGHAVFLKGAELGVDILSDRMFKIVASTYKEGLYTEDEIDCFTTTPGGKPPVLMWDIIDESRIPEWAKSRFFYPSGNKRKKAKPGFPIPKLSPEESPDDSNVTTPQDAYFSSDAELSDEPLNVPWASDSFDRKLFIPGLHGQVDVYKSRFQKLLPRMDSVITLGNMLRLAPFQEYGANADEEPVNMSPTIANFNLFKELIENTQNSVMPFVNIIGANEIAYLNLPKEAADNYLKDSPNGTNYVREGWLTDEKVSKVAFRYYVAVEVDGRLVTHAGLSYGEWVNLGKPQTAREAAYALNIKYLGTLYQGQCYRLGDGINYAANPIMAHPIAEVYSSWMSTPEICPFPQIHGSISMRDLTGHEVSSTYLHPMFYAEKMRYHRWGTSITLKGQSFYAVEGPRKSLVKLSDYQRGYGTYTQAVHKQNALPLYAPNVPSVISADGSVIC